MSDLGQLVEEHVRAALLRAEPPFPALAVDSWSDPASVGQWVLVEDDEGRRSQGRMDHLIVRGLPLQAGNLARSASRLVDAVLADLRDYAALGGTVVSRPRPEPVGSDGVDRAHIEFRGVWLLLSVGTDPTRGVPVAVLSALLGRAVPLAEPEESVVWL